jgi:hypothetical protein
MADHVVAPTTPPMQPTLLDEKKDDVQIQTIAEISGSSSPRSKKQTSYGDLKFAKDGTTVLVPQPSDDPRDPLNWSWMKKHAVFTALLPGWYVSVSS